MRGLNGMMGGGSDSDDDDDAELSDAMLEKLKNPPRITRIIDVTMYFDYTDPDFMGYAVEPGNWIDEYFQLADTPAPLHPGPLIPANPVPKPDYELVIWINGIMYPNYDLFLAKGPLRPYTTAEEMNENRYHGIGSPNVWARPSRPLGLTKANDKYNRYEHVWGPPADGTGTNMSIFRPPLNSWREGTTPHFGLNDYGSAEKVISTDKFGNKVFDASETRGITNNTNLVWLPKDKWIRVIIQNGGPMTHPFHLHGFKAYILGHKRQWGKGAAPPERSHENKCTVSDERYNPMKLKNIEGCRQAGAPFVNSFGADLIPPVRHRTQITLADEADLNQIDPVVRDMVIVPEHGYNSFQFFTSNVGAWFFHCHLEFHVGIGMGLNWIFGADDPRGEWIKAGLPPYVIVQQNEAYCPDVEFEGPLQFY